VAHVCSTQKIAISYRKQTNNLLGYERLYALLDFGVFDISCFGSAAKENANYWLMPTPTQRETLHRASAAARPNISVIDI